MSLICWEWKPRSQSGMAEGLRGKQRSSALLLLVECKMGHLWGLLHLACPRQCGSSALPRQQRAWLCHKVRDTYRSLCFPWLGSLWSQHAAPCKDATTSLCCPGHTCGLSPSTYLCFSRGYFTLTCVLSQAQPATAQCSRSQTVKILQI